MAGKRLWNGYGDTMLGYACEALAVVVYILWVLPRTVWLRFTGRIPPR